MARKKVSAAIPEELLSKACRVSKLNQTDALIEGLRQLIRFHERRKWLLRAGKVQFEVSRPLRERVRL